ncbi:amino acid adenylation domain-containing protein [Micromonospora echinaurantiaca]|uniref:amino acid adenylation domain-containing protein n=1 Tax=Micromonospora echinaurantiaca TaxID=47857 RepID=UPI0037B5EAA3
MIEPAVTVSELVDTLEAHGVELWEEDGQLRFRAPRGVLTEQRRETLRARRPELLAYLKGAPTAGLEPDPAARHDPFPLTDIQMSYVLGRRSAFAYSGVGCHAYGELTFPDLDGDRVAEVWRMLVRRHDMLRARIDPAGSQRIVPDPPALVVPVLDLRGRGPAAVAAAIDGVRAELDHRVYPPDGWPLFEVRVTRADDRAVLHLSIDFLVADYVSIQLLLEEFTRCYHDPGHRLPPLELSFRDYLLGERQLRGTRRYAKDREYWWHRIDTLPPAPELVVLGDRPAEPGGVRFHRWQLHLPTEAYEGLKRLAADRGVTPSVAVLAAYAEVIGRWSKGRRFLLNLTMLRRLPLHPQVDRLVGDFTSAVLLEVDGDAGASFGERAGAVQQQLWADMDHLLVSGVEVLRELARRRGQDAALMPVVFTSALGLGTAGESGPQRVGFGYGISQTPQVWIDCQALERSDGLVVNWDVRQGIFPDGMVEAMFGAFQALVRQLAAGQRWDDADPVELPADQLARRAEVNDTTAPLTGALLHDGVVAQCRRTPDRPAVIGADRTLSYGELLTRAAAVAEALRAAGAAPGDLVAVLLPPGPDQVVAVLGVLLAGGAYLPVDTRAPVARKESLVDAAGARYAVTTADAEGLPAGVRRIVVDGLPPADQPVAPVGVTDRDTAYVIYTSGSTGRPKGVVIPHRGAVNTVEDINRRFAVGPDDRVLGLAGLSFDLSVYDIFGPLAVGAALVLPAADRRGDPSHWAELIRDHRVTLWNSVPAQLQMLADYLAVADTTGLDSLRLAMLSGDWIPVRLPDQIRALIPGLVLHSLGGATEGSIWSIGYPIDEVPAEWPSIPYGRPLTNQSMHVLDEAMRPCPDWAVGELYIGGVGVADGYLGDPELTARRFVRHPVTGERLYRTGDLGRYLPSGDIEFLGREDLQVKIRGHRIELAEIEAAAQSYPPVGAAAVVVEGDAPLERRLVAFVEPARRADGPDDPLDLAASAVRELAAIRAEQDGEQAVRFARQLDHTALLAMIRALRDQGLFTSAEVGHTVDEVMRTARVGAKHQRLIRRWLAALERHGLIRRDPAGRLRPAPESLTVDADTVRAAWQEIDRMQDAGGLRTELVGYFRTASAHLPELMRDEVDPVQLLFPQGRLDIQESAYQGNFLSHSLNRLVVRAMCDLAAAWPDDRPMRVLEVGAGVGGTSIDLIPALDGYPVRYAFTDVSQFFLNSARERFADYPWVDYHLFDLNVDFRTQGMTANSVDVILCANVLHYARDAGQALARFRELLRPGGWLVFIETTRDNYQILTSMEFLFDATAGDFADVRAGRDETFISAPQWRELLAAAGAAPAVQLSATDAALDAIGMHVFAARFKPDRVDVDPAALRRHLAERLPEYMLPSRLEVLDAIPLTANDKVDRAALRALLPRAAAARGAGSAEPSGELETAIAAIWADVLNVERVGRDDDLFSLGGDSLLAAQLVGRIRDDVPAASGALFDTLLRDLLEGATVRTIAAGLTGGDTAGDTAEPATGPAAAPALPFPVPPEGPVRLELPGDATAEDPERRAAGYLPALRAELRGRPVELTGRDLGGVLAAELARQLGEAGVTVSGLTVVAGLPLPDGAPGELVGEYLFTRELGVDPADLGLPGEADLARAVEAGDESVFGALAAEPADWRLARIAAVLDVDPTELTARHAAFRSALDALVRHGPPLYAGDLALVFNFDRSRWPRAAARVERRWREACLGELRVIDGARP